MFDQNGRPISSAEPERTTATGLPHWCHSISYRADDDIITMGVKIPTSAGLVVVNLEAVPEDTRALIAALKRCVERSEMTVLDAPATETPLPPEPPEE
jgi:hypothetical protein